MKKFLFVLLVVFMVSALLVSCTSDGSVPGSEGQPGEASDPAAGDEASTSDENQAAEDVPVEAGGKKHEFKDPILGRSVAYPVEELIGMDTDSPAQYDYTFALHNYSETFESSVLIANSVRKSAEAHGIEVVEADCNIDTSKVQPNVDSLLLQDIDAMIDATWFADVGKMTYQKTDEYGIPLLAFDILIEEGKTWYLGADLNEAGRVAARYMTDLVEQDWAGEVDYLVITYPQALGEAMLTRMQAGIDGLRESGVDLPDEKILWYDSGGDMLNAKTIVTDFLTAHPDDDNILVYANNDMSAVGCLGAVESSGRSDDVMIFSLGGESSAIENFRGEENAWKTSAGLFLEYYGNVAVNAAIAILEGEEVAAGLGPEVAPITYDNVATYYPES